MVKDDQWNRQRETERKILAVFVWQQKAEEPQGHTNERKAFQQGGGGGQQGRGASGVREVNLAGIPQQQMLH